MTSRNDGGSKKSRGIKADPNVPIEVAGELGLIVRPVFGLPLRVGSDSGTIFYGWDSDPRVRSERIWEGIAQFVLTGRGRAWSELEALDFGIFVREIMEWARMRPDEVAKALKANARKPSVPSRINQRST